MKDTATVAAKNRRIRQEAMREQLANYGLLGNVLDIQKKLGDESLELDPAMAQRLKAAADINLKLIAKYLPDIKAIELTGEGGGPVEAQTTIDASKLSSESLRELLNAKRDNPE